MTRRQAILGGAVLGLVAPVAELTLLWFGLGGDFWIDKTDITVALWPFFLILVVGWNRTVLGIAVTLLAVLLNSLLYGLVAYSLHRCIGMIRRQVNPVK